MVKSISNDLNNDEIDASFNIIDADNSNSIEFNELSNYYNKVNGEPDMEKKPSIQN
jgi:Ca2+-binding EF-hand superfamily protein